MEKFIKKSWLIIKEGWFNIAIILLLFLLSIVIIEIRNYNYTEKIKSFIVFATDNSLGIIFLCLVYYLTYYWIHNHKILKKYKRENNRDDNGEKYIAQRCYEDGFGYDKDGIIIKPEIEEKEDKNGKKYFDVKKEEKKDKNGNKYFIIKNDEENNRHYFYLVKEEKRFYRIVDTYTLNRLGYPTPSRKSEKCFRLADGYKIGEEIKIHNIISDIKNIIKLKD